MTTPKEIHITLDRFHRYDIESNALKFIERLNKLINSIPKEYHNSIIIELDTEGDCDARYPELSIWYKRMETVEEAEQKENAIGQRFFSIIAPLPR